MNYPTCILHYSSSQFRLVTPKVLRSHMWPVTATRAAQIQTQVSCRRRLVLSTGIGNFMKKEVSK